MYRRGPRIWVAGPYDMCQRMKLDSRVGICTIVDGRIREGELSCGLRGHHTQTRPLNDTSRQKMMNKFGKAICPSQRLVWNRVNYGLGGQMLTQGAL